MGLTDDQYGQVSRYVAGEMAAGEKHSFEESINASEGLAAEVQRCRQIKALFASAHQKLNENLLPDASEKNEEVEAMIAQARADWGREHERKPAIQKNTLPHTTKKRTGTSIEMPRQILLIAAIIIGLICIGVWWFLQQPPSQATTANGLPNENNPVTGKKSDETTKATPPKKDTSIKSTRLPLPGDTTRKTADATALFAAYFTPDAAPADKDPQQKETFDFYTAKNYPAAIEDFEMWKATLETRGAKKQAVNTAFYVHYYLALSYLSSGKGTKKAISELRSALQTASNATLKEKAQWYLALANLKSGNATEARTLLQQLQATAGYQQKATELLLALNINNK